MRKENYMNWFENQWVEVFRIGSQTDSAGNTKEWTTSDLETMVTKYNQQKEHESPLVIGHPKDNAPAWGWVEELKTDGKTLFAKFKQLVPEFVDAVKQGMYKKRSISIYPDLMLRHIGFLGAVPPAVKGLADIKFNEQESITIEYSQDNEKGEKHMTVELEKKIADLTTALNKANGDFSEYKTAKEQEIDELKKKIPAEKPQKTEFEEALEQKTAELQAKLDAADKKSRIAEYKEFVGGLHKEGKIVSDKQNDIVDLMEALNGLGELNFSDKKESALDRFKAYLSAQPVMVEFKESVNGSNINNLSADAQLNELAMKKAKENNMSFNQALVEAQQENPELARQAASEIL